MSDVSDFITAVDNGNFVQLFGRKIEEFTTFVKANLREKRQFIVVRFNMEHTYNVGKSEVLEPYYVWVVYHMKFIPPNNIGFRAVKLFYPDESDITSYLITPSVLEDEPFFDAPYVARKESESV